MEALTIEQIINATQGKSLYCNDDWYGSHSLTEVQNAEQFEGSVRFTGEGYRYGIYVDNGCLKELLDTGQAERQPRTIEQCVIRTRWTLR